MIKSSLWMLVAGLVAIRVSSEPAVPPVRAPEAAAPRDDAAFEHMELWTEAVHAIRHTYVDPTRTGYRELTEMALRGLMTELDRYSQYLTPEQYRALREETAGGFGGIGIVWERRGGDVVVAGSHNGRSPGWRAGLRPGDRILGIDGFPTSNMTLREISSRLRGPPGTAVRLRWKKPDAEALVEAEIIREQIDVPSVWGPRVVAPGIGYVRLSEFSERTAVELDDALSGLEAQGARAFVLDLRNNPGGLLTSAVRVCDLFLRPNRLVVSTRGRRTGDNEEYRTPGAMRSRAKTPLVVLMNRGSASASEIVAGALRDHRRARLVGQRTFGKGSVQSLIPLSGEGALRITTAHYFTPGGHVIDDAGIEPDEDVPMREADLALLLAPETDAAAGAGKRPADPQLERAVAWLQTAGK